MISADVATCSKINNKERKGFEMGNTGKESLPRRSKFEKEICAAREIIRKEKELRRGIIRKAIHTEAKDWRRKLR